MPTQFEILEEKIEQALRLIADLRHERGELQQRLQESDAKKSELELLLGEKDKEIHQLNSNLEHKSRTMAEAGEKIDGLIAKLEEEGLEQLAV